MKAICLVYKTSIFFTDHFSSLSKDFRILTCNDAKNLQHILKFNFQLDYLQFYVKNNDFH